MVTGKNCIKKSRMICKLYFSPNMFGRSSRRGCGARYVGSVGNKRNGYTGLVGKLEGTRSLGVTWRKWQSYIKLYLE